MSDENSTPAASGEHRVVITDVVNGTMITGFH